MNDDAELIHVEVHGAALEDLRAFAQETDADLGCRATPRREAEGWVVDAYLPEDRLEAARSTRSAGRVRLEVRENATAVGRERQAEVGTGNRFSGGDAERGRATVRGTRMAPVRGLGEKR
ncbi:hypothetical protein ACFYE2_03800 [Kocuria sp. CPCC 205300]|uniref:hypothetical protein n=1 Tax=Kocuria sabuli TaxID=3071448 RepID=UPI0036DD6A2E